MRVGVESSFNSLNYQIITAMVNFLNKMPLNGRRTSCKARRRYIEDLTGSTTHNVPVMHTMSKSDIIF